MQSFRSAVFLVLIWVISGIPGIVVAEEEHIGLNIASRLEGRAFLGEFDDRYVNYAEHPYNNPPNVVYPYVDDRRNFYDPLGNFVINGVEMYRWEESRTLDPEPSSYLWKAGDFFDKFNRAIVGSFSNNNWSSKIIIGSEIKTIFTPLTMQIAGLNGVRWDLTTPNNQGSAIFSRFSNPIALNPRLGPDDVASFDYSTILFGGHWKRQIGIIGLGFTYLNHHVFDPQLVNSKNSYKGVPARYPPPTYIAVRITDDSPDDELGPIIYKMRIYVNDELRDDIVPGVIVSSRQNPTAVGTLNRLTNEFRRSTYAKFGGIMFRDKEIPLFADYLYLRDLLDGKDVSARVSVDELQTYFRMLDSKVPQHADGYNSVTYYFDLSSVPSVKSVRFEALLSGDYRIDVTDIYYQSPIPRYEVSYGANFYYPVAWAHGNVQDDSNLNWVRFNYGAPTGLAVCGVDMNMHFKGIRVNGEYVYNFNYFQYPNKLAQGKYGARNQIEDKAYYLSVEKDSRYVAFGGEYFHIGPGYNTVLRTYEPRAHQGAVGVENDPTWDFRNNTWYWHLVEDNDDRDRYPEIGRRNQQPLFTAPGDIDGVFPGRDENHNGLVDTNENNNLIPDYDEPFLMYGVEPDEFVYGPDMNNNDIIDDRENDDKLDYPYDEDSHGYHVFVRFNPIKGIGVTLGKSDWGQIAGGERTSFGYGRVSFRKENIELGGLFVENELKVVQDGIRDDYYTQKETVIRIMVEEISRPTWAFEPTLLKDPLNYRDSIVNRLYVETKFRGIRSLNVINSLKYELNYQRRRLFEDGTYQKRDVIRSLAMVNKLDYTWNIGRFKLTPQMKFLLLRRQRDNMDIPLDYEWSSIPIIRAEYWLTDRTVVRAGVQGFPGFSYRFIDYANFSNSFRMRTAMMLLTNKYSYFGYDANITLGLSYENKRYDDVSRRFDNFNVYRVFVNAFLGFK